jgi:hypothetical protein
MWNLGGEAVMALLEVGTPSDNELLTPNACPKCNSANITIQHEHTWYSGLGRKWITEPAFVSCQDCHKVTRLSKQKTSGDHHVCYYGMGAKA